MAKESVPKASITITPKRAYYDKTSDFVKNWVKFSKGEEPVIPDILEGCMTIRQFFNIYRDLCLRHLEFVAAGDYDEDGEEITDSYAFVSSDDGVFEAEYKRLIINSGIVDSFPHGMKARVSDRFCVELCKWIVGDTDDLIDLLRSTDMDFDPHREFRHKRFDDLMTIPLGDHNEYPRPGICTTATNFTCIISDFPCLIGRSVKILDQPFIKVVCYTLICLSSGHSYFLENRLGLNREYADHFFDGC